MYRLMKVCWSSFYHLPQKYVLGDFFSCPSPLPPFFSVLKWWKASSSGWLLGIFLCRYSTRVVVVGGFFFYKNRPVIFVQHFTWRTKQGTQQQQRAQWQLTTLRAATISKPTRAASSMSQTLSRFFGKPSNKKSVVFFNIVQKAFDSSPLVWTLCCDFFWRNFNKSA